MSIESHPLFLFLTESNSSHSIAFKKVIAVSKMDSVDWSLIGMQLSTGPWVQARHQRKILDRVMITHRSVKMVREHTNLTIPCACLCKTKKYWLFVTIDQHSKLDLSITVFFSNCGFLLFYNVISNWSSGSLWNKPIFCTVSLLFAKRPTTLFYLLVQWMWYY